jgi:hypothetical protein
MLPSFGGPEARALLPIFASNASKVRSLTSLFPNEGVHSYFDSLFKNGSTKLNATPTNR